MTETLLKSDTGIRLEGYQFYGRKREGKTGGGVGVLVRNDIRHNVAPHTSNRGIECIWMSIRRKGIAPLMIGTYYGRQESRCNKDEIEREMVLLTEEIKEMGREGEVMMAMDANTKTGILGESISRNGKLLIHTFEETGLKIMNLSEKCRGKITRKNTKNDQEISAIDLVVANQTIEQWITGIDIDEEGLMKVRGKNETDHNTISISLNVKNIDRTRPKKRTIWNLRASGEKWAEYANELTRKIDITTNILNHENKSTEQKYKEWYKEVEGVARKTIGKTTIKEGGKEKFSRLVDEMRTEKRNIKKMIQNETDNFFLSKRGENMGIE